MTFFQENKQVFDFMFSILKENKKIYLKYFIFVSLISAIWLVLPYIAKLETDQLAYKYDNFLKLVYDDPFRIFVIILLIIFVVNFLDRLLDWFKSRFEFSYSKLIDNKLDLTFYKRLNNVDLWFFLSDRNKKLIWDLSKSIHLDDIIEFFLKDFFPQFFTFIWIVMVFAYMNIWVWLVLLISTIISYYLTRYRENVDYKFELTTKYNDSYFNSYVYKGQFEYNFPDLCLTGWYNFLISNMESQLNTQYELANKNKKHQYILNLLTFIHDNITDIIIKAIIWFSIFYGTQSIWFMTMSLMYSSRLTDFFRFFINLRMRLIDYKEKIQLCKIMFNLTNPKDIAKKEISSFDSIVVENLRFAYPKVSEYELQMYQIILTRLKRRNLKYDWEKEEFHIINKAFEDAKVPLVDIIKWINLKFESWKIYWIVGKNWAWKTTLTNLIMWFFSDYDWNIMIWNQSLKELSRESFMKNISVITQVPYIMDWLTIKENLLLWVEKNYSDDYIVWLLEEFGLMKTISSFREWINSKIWYNCNLSWWQNQLLILIRILLQDRKILIFDEWTNQLDAENELKVMEKLLVNKNDKIVIFITHRMTTIRKADIIYCLEDWVVLDNWTHEELISWDNVYARFWKAQVGW